MIFGWHISPVWELTLWVGLVAYFTFFFYMTFFGVGPFTASVWSDLQKYEKAWWNRRATFWISFTFVLLTFAPLFATFVLEFFFQDLHFRWSFIAALLAVARNDPLLLFIWAAIAAPFSSLFIVLLLLQVVSGSTKGAGLAKNFNSVFIVSSLLLFVVQSFLLWLGLK